MSRSCGASAAAAEAADWLFDFSLLSLLSRRSTQIKTYSWDNAQVVLAGNKCDMEEERVVSVDSGRLLAEQLGKSGVDNPASLTVSLILAGFKYNNQEGGG